MRYEVTWCYPAYGTLYFEVETDEQATQLLQLLGKVRQFAVDPTSQISIEGAVQDLLSKGFVDVTPPGEKCPSYDEAYVFRGPDGVLYGCMSPSAVLNVFAEYQRFEGVKVPAGETWHCSVGSRRGHS